MKRGLGQREVDKETPSKGGARKRFHKEALLRGLPRKDGLRGRMRKESVKESVTKEMK